MAVKFTELFIRNLKPAAKPYSKREAGGFLILVRPNGSKSWQVKFDYRGVRQTLTIG
jgi:hypothetical protein